MRDGAAGDREGDSDGEWEMERKRGREARGGADIHNVTCGGHSNVDAAACRSGLFSFRKQIPSSAATDNSVKCSHQWSIIMERIHPKPENFHYPAEAPSY